MGSNGVGGRDAAQGWLHSAAGALEGAASLAASTWLGGFRASARASRGVAQAAGGLPGARLAGHLAATAEACCDPAELSRLISEGLAEARLLTDLGELGGILPESLTGGALREQLQRIIDHPPAHLLAALEDGASRPAAVVTALFRDAPALGVLTVAVPVAAARLGAGVGGLLLSGDASLEDLTAYWRGRRFETWHRSNGSSPQGGSANCEPRSQAEAG